MSRTYSRRITGSLPATVTHPAPVPADMIQIGKRDGARSYFRKAHIAVSPASAEMRAEQLEIPT